MADRKLIFGCGYLGLEVAQRWLKLGHEVWAVTRRADKAERLRSAGMLPIVADITRPETLTKLPAVESVLFSVGFERGGPQSIHDVYVSGLRTAVAALPEIPGRFLYISSTGVFGRADGELVTEATAPDPRREGGRAHWEAEQWLATSPVAGSVIVLRMAGIYGPGRIPRRRDIEAGEPIAAASEGWLNLIHVVDGARAVLAAEARAEPPELYLVSDGNPAIRGDYYRVLADLLGAPAPRFVDPAPDSPQARRAAADKRVSNEKLRSQLSLEFDYPSCREGLTAILSSESG